MEFKEKSAELKVACPTCGLARPDSGDAMEKESVCHCDPATASENNPTQKLKGMAEAIAHANNKLDEEPFPDFEGESLAKTLIKEEFQVVSFLGHGCVTDTYVIRNSNLKKKFVLKILSLPYSKNPRTAKRFRIATAKSVQLSHPNIVTVYEADEGKDGSSYAVSEFVESATLADVIKREGFLDPEEVVELMTQACEALQYAHESKVIHRGIKPSNLFLLDRKLDSYSAKVSDFGTTVALPHAGRETSVRPNNTKEFGDPRYMSPEQCVGERLTSASDVYSLGCVMYEALCGKAPFESKNPMTIALRQMTEEVRPISSRFKDLDIPEDLEAIILHALIKDPRKRYQNAEEMLKDLQRFGKQKRVSKPKDFGDAPIAVSRASHLLAHRMEPSNLSMATIALLVLAVCLGAAAFWFLFGISPEKNELPASPPAVSIRPQAPPPPSHFVAKLAEEAGLIPHLVSLEDNNGKILFSSSEVSTTRQALAEAVRQKVSLANVNLCGQEIGALDLNGVDFSGANLRHAFLSGCLMKGANLSGADLSGAVLNGAHLDYAVATRANFDGVKMYGGQLLGANLRGASFANSRIYSSDFSKADLTGCNFTLAKMENANLTDAIVIDTNFDKAGLSRVKQGVTTSKASPDEPIDTYSGHRDVSEQIR